MLHIRDLPMIKSFGLFLLFFIVLEGLGTLLWYIITTYFNTVRQESNYIITYGSMLLSAFFWILVLFLRRKVSVIQVSIAKSKILIIIVLSLCFFVLMDPIRRFFHADFTKEILLIKESVKFNLFIIKLIGLGFAAPFAEELVFRHFMITSVFREKRMGIFLSLFFFVLIHTNYLIIILGGDMNEIYFMWVNMFFLGVFLTFIYLKFNFIGSFFAHSIYNMLILLFPVIQQENIVVPLAIYFAFILVFGLFFLFFILWGFKRWKGKEKEGTKHVGVF